MKKRVAILGATGSIGKSALDVVSRAGDDFEVVLLSAHTDKAGIAALGEAWPGAALVLSGGDGGKEKLLATIAGARPGITVNGIAGAAGLEPSLAAIEAGSDLALANKETLVMAGPLVFALAAEKNVKILPVDSEHSAVFHLLEAHRPARGGEPDVEEILLTASGGPFRKYSLEEMKRVTPEDALAHPTWSMGPKITVDSASLANKGLEVIEAVRLFNMPPEKIKVLVHPQSVVHSMIRLRDGAVYAQLSRPDMRHPIHAALYWPEVKPSGIEKLEFDSLTLEFEKPDAARFPMLGLAYGAAGMGALYPCAYNAANEIAVAAFLERRIGFLDIPRIVDRVLKRDWSGDLANLGPVLEADVCARAFALSCVKAL
jgi:1-deoxy-D-xylulose-5-phosphate reductoisomerase